MILSDRERLHVTTSAPYSILFIFWYLNFCSLWTPFTANENVPFKATTNQEIHQNSNEKWALLQRHSQRSITQGSWGHRDLSERGHPTPAFSGTLGTPRILRQVSIDSANRKLLSSLLTNVHVCRISHCSATCSGKRVVADTPSDKQIRRRERTDTGIYNPCFLRPFRRVMPDTLCHELPPIHVETHIGCWDGATCLILSFLPPTRVSVVEGDRL